MQKSVCVFSTRGASSARRQHIQGVLEPARGYSKQFRRGGLLPVSCLPPSTSSLLGLSNFEMLTREHLWSSCSQTAISRRVPTSDSCRTGDTAAQEGDPPYWRILGRSSTDIIKSGGYKISALHIEDVLLAHPGVSSCAVLGIPDEALGEAIAAVIACSKSQVQALQ